MIVKRIGTLNSFGINIFALNNGINFNTYKEAWKDFGGEWPCFTGQECCRIKL